MNEPEIITVTTGYKRTPDRREKLLSFLRAGATRKDAAAAAGIHKDTFYEWMKESDFSDAVREAEGECAALMSARIYHEATSRNGNWRAALEWLRRRRRDEWGDVSRVDVTKLTDEQLIALLDRAAAQGSEAEGPEHAESGAEQ